MLKQLFRKKSKTGLYILYLMTFFLALSGALPAYIQSSYLEKYIGLSSVTLFFIVANSISLLSILVFPKFIKKVGNYLSACIMAIIVFIGLGGLSYSTASLSLFIFFILMQFALNLIWINMDVFVENFSNDATTGKTRTIYFTIINLAWIISPSISAWLISNGSYQLVFLISALSIIPFLIILSLNKKIIKDKISYKKRSLLKAVKQTFASRDLRGVFVLSLLLNIFYNISVLFIPIYLHQHLGFSWLQLGWMFSFMLIPFILVEIPAGIISDKYIGEKEFFYVGFSIIIVCLCLFSLIVSTNPWVWALLLFLSRIGCSLVEAMRESYFFKKINSTDVDKINIFRTTIPFGTLLGSVLGLIVLSLLPVNFLFLTTGIILLSAFYFLPYMKDTK